MVALSHRATYLLAKKWPKWFPILFVVGYPKSGTTWASQVVADYLGMPLIVRSILPVGVHSVLHGHQIVQPDGPATVYTVRDGRDVMVSMYFFLIRGMPSPDAGIETLPPGIRQYFRGMSDLADVRSNLPLFIHRQMENPPSSPANWPDHVRISLAADREGVPLIRYEDLLRDGPETLAKAMQILTGETPDMDRCRASSERFAFTKLTGRKAGREDRGSFLRKGKAGDWQNHFSREAAEVFDQYAGDMLIELDYESDRSWITDCNG